MNILFTGMGSHHCKRPDNTSFFTVLDSVLSEYAQVTWASPSLSWTKEDLEKYDHIIFGFLPPTSLSANKVYGGLHVLGLMFDSPKLKIVVDSPQIWQYKNSIAAVVKDPSILFGVFYSRREGYQTILKTPSVVEKATAHMLVSEWPSIIYPALPWNTDQKIRSILGFGNPEKVYGVNFDSLIVDPEVPRIGRKDYWSVENIKNSWVDSLEKTTVFPKAATKVGRKTDDLYALQTIRDGIGLIVPPQERNMTTWWNYRIIQALNTSTPIVTNWLDTKNFSDSWSLLPYQVEDMSPAQRQQLASTQRGVYLESIPSNNELEAEVTKLLLGSTLERLQNA